MLRSHTVPRISWAWLGLAPFLVFMLAFEVAPLMMLVKSALTAKGAISLDNFARALSPAIVSAFINSIGLSLATATAGTIAGAIVAHLIVNSRNTLVKNRASGD